MTLHPPDLTQIPFSLLLPLFFYLFSFSYACLFLFNLGRPQNHYAGLELTTPPSVFQNLGYVFQVCTITTRSNVNLLIMPTHTHPHTKTGFHILALSILELRPVKWFLMINWCLSSPTRLYSPGAYRVFLTNIAPRYSKKWLAKDRFSVKLQTDKMNTWEVKNEQLLQKPKDKFFFLRPSHSSWTLLLEDKEDILKICSRV